jgi:hypothetical protein
MPSLRPIPREAMRTFREVRQRLPFPRGELLTRLGAHCSPDSFSLCKNESITLRPASGYAAEGFVFHGGPAPETKCSRQ